MYCTLEDILDGLGVSVVAQLSNDSDPTTINVAVINMCLSSATETIDGYLRSVYTLPLKNTHFMLKRIAIDLVKYELHNRRDQAYEAIQTIYANAISRLKDIQIGKITLDEGSPDLAPQQIVTNSRQSVFNKSILGL